MGNMMYEQDSRIYFQQAEQPVKASIQGNTLVLEVNAMMNATADSYLAIFHIIQLGQSAEEADPLMNERVERYRHAIRASVPAAPVTAGLGGITCAITGIAVRTFL